LIEMACLAVVVPIGTMSKLPFISSIRP
jgi:hypothetical protein